jgi:O-acetyl-ADP-ribose deacetylase (regulator of RNase III)
VDGAIHRAAGKVLEEELEVIRRRQGGCETGKAVITRGGRLPARLVIHTVGPVWTGGKSGEDEKLAEAYRNSLRLALAHEIVHIAFPNISTGVYGFPKPLAAEIAVRQVRLFLESKHPYPTQITFCCFDEENYRIYHRLLADTDAWRGDALA